MIKKYLILFIMVLSAVVFLKNSYCAPAYGTYMPKVHRYIWGIEGNFLIDRNLDHGEGAANGNRFFITGSYGIFEWLSADGKIGIGNVRWDKDNSDDLDYSTNFAGAYGFRVKGYENKKMGIKSVMGFQHISVHPRSRISQDNNKNQVIIDEWQGSIVVSKDIGDFIPYLGARYGTLDFIKRINEHDRKRIKAEKNTGIIIGADYWLKNRMKLNLEYTFLDGRELAIGLSRDF